MCVTFGTCTVLFGDESLSITSETYLFVTYVHIHKVSFRILVKGGQNVIQWITIVSHFYTLFYKLHFGSSVQNDIRIQRKHVWYTAQR